ncbi:MAG TPA: flavin reductase family protein [Thermoleophilaceae bacterium]
MPADEAARAFESLVGSLDYPMFIATTRGAGERAGCLVGFATQCSIDPPRFLVCVSDKNRTYRVIESGAEAMVVHVAPRDAHDLVELFGGDTGDEEDKFEHCEWRDGPEGVPVLSACPSWFAGWLVDRVRLGDHVGYVLEPFDGAADPDLRPYPFARAKRIEPGHEA